jgi:hypothetical protein
MGTSKNCLRHCLGFLPLQLPQWAFLTGTHRTRIFRGVHMMTEMKATLRAALLALAGLSVTSIAPSAVASGINFKTYTTANGLGSNRLNNVFIDNGIIYAATQKGLSISRDDGATFVNHFPGEDIGGVYADGVNIYAATLYSGLRISYNGGLSWTTFNTYNSNGLRSNNFYNVIVSSGKIYGATNGGLSVTSDGGNNWTTYTQADGLGSGSVKDIFVDGDHIYAALISGGGLSISQNGGISWISRSLHNGYVQDVHVDGNSVYAAVASKGLEISRNGGSTFTNIIYVPYVEYGMRSIYAIGDSIYLGHTNGLSISYDGAKSWTAYSISDGLQNTRVTGLYVDNTRIYAATYGGLSISNVPVSNAPVPVPAPMPVLGFAYALRYSRRIRKAKRRCYLETQKATSNNQQIAEAL